MSKIIITFLFSACLATAALAQKGKKTTAAAGVECMQTTMLKPSPFLGTANEIMVLADGSIWEDMSYKYLYLYAYNPQVIICPSQGRMMVDAGGTMHTFQVNRVR